MLENTKVPLSKTFACIYNNSCIEIYLLCQIPREKMDMVNITSRQWEAQRETIQVEELPGRRDHP